jgi:hypothetical protein
MPCGSTRNVPSEVVVVPRVAPLPVFGTAVAAGVVDDDEEAGADWLLDVELVLVDDAGTVFAAEADDDVELLPHAAASSAAPPASMGMKTRGST